MGKLILQIIAGILGLWLATKFVPGVEFSGSLQALCLAGIVLGLINFFIKPILKFITLPLRILTFGLFSLVINIGIVWLVADVLFPGDLEIHGLLSLILTTLIIWFVSLFLGLYNPRRKVIVEE